MATVRSTEDIRKMPELAGMRQITIDDVEKIVSLIEACREEDKIETVPTAENMRFQFQTPGIEVIGNAWALVDATGDFIGTVVTVPLPGVEAFMIQADATVRPDHRGSSLEDTLMEFAVANAQEWCARTRNKALIQAGCRSDRTRQIDLYTRHGFEPIRYFHTLERDLEQPIVPIATPDGFVIRKIDFEAEAEQMHLALSESFQDHFNPMNFTLEQTKHWASSPEYRTDLILLAYEVVDGAEREAAGITMNHIRTNYNLQHGTKEGEVNAVGVRRAFRRKGVARALLTRSMELLKAEGMTTAVLSVDSVNPLGATQLYASVGFTQRKTSVVFQLNDA